MGHLAAKGFALDKFDAGHLASGIKPPHPFLD